MPSLPDNSRTDFLPFAAQSAPIFIPTALSPKNITLSTCGLAIHWRMICFVSPEMMLSVPGGAS